MIRRVFGTFFCITFLWGQSVKFSEPGGWYADKVDVSLSGSGTIYYTTDGSTPKIPLENNLQNGVICHYHMGDDFDTKVSGRIIDGLHMDWSLASVDPHVMRTRNFSVRMESTLKPPHSGEYTFYLNSNHTARLYINEQSVLDVDYDDDEAKIVLSADSSYTIILEMVNDATSSWRMPANVVSLQWSSDAFGQEKIGHEYLYIPSKTKVYESPISIHETTVLRASTMNGGDDLAQAQTYFIEEKKSSLPVIAISADPENLWSNDSGYYVAGDSAADQRPYFGANFHQSWEKPVYMEYYTSKGTLGFEQGMGMRGYGAWSRAHTQKSKAFFARKQYGDGDLDYPLFDSKDIDSYEAFILRNSGNDWLASLMRDALMTSVISHTSLDIQAYSPVVVYLNGEYWGIMNAREKINEHFIADNHGLDHKDSIDLLGFEYKNYLDDPIEVLEGSADHYHALIDYITDNDVSDEDVYQNVSERMDVDNFALYQAVQIYYGNTDWPANNTKFWRSTELDGKWRWILYDTDFGLQEADSNTLVYATQYNGKNPPDYPNPQWATFLLHNLLQNQEFENKFINTFMDHMNSSFKEERMKHFIDSLDQKIASEIPLHFERWDGDMEYRDYLIEQYHEFAEERPDYMKGFLEEFFDMDLGVGSIEVSLDEDHSGVVQINSLLIRDFPWEGEYFREVPLELTAVPLPGYEFSHWSGGVDETDQSITINVDLFTAVRAHFIESSSEDNPVVVNEINYHSPDDKDTGDWLELFNHSAKDVDLSGWVLKDENDVNSYTFANNLTLKAGGYLVVARDIQAFQNINSGIDEYSILGPLSFGFSNGGELIRLYDSYGVLRDSVEYQDSLPWPVAADGNGASLGLISPDLDNALAESWTVNYGGTPGRENAEGEPVSSSSGIGLNSSSDESSSGDASSSSMDDITFIPGNTISKEQLQIVYSLQVDIRLPEWAEQVEVYDIQGVKKKVFSMGINASGLSTYLSNSPGVWVLKFTP